MALRMRKGFIEDGRTLAWVWYGHRYSKLLNTEIVKEGYGFSFRKYPTSRLKELNRIIE